mgnify:CR=1 FL=1
MPALPSIFELEKSLRSKIDMGVKIRTKDLDFSNDEPNTSLDSFKTPISKNTLKSIETTLVRAGNHHPCEAPLIYKNGCAECRSEDGHTRDCRSFDHKMRWIAHKNKIYLFTTVLLRAILEFFKQRLNCWENTRTNEKYKCSNVASQFSSAYKHELEIARPSLHQGQHRCATAAVNIFERMVAKRLSLYFAYWSDLEW